MSDRHYDFFKKLGYSENENLSDANEEDIKYVENFFKQHFGEYVIDDIQLCSNNELWNRYRSCLENSLDENGNTNELDLFHGAEIQKLLRITREGFDLTRSRPGIFGAGAYFGDLSKANEFSFAKQAEIVQKSTKRNQACYMHKDRTCNICQRTVLLCSVNLGRSRKMLGPFDETIMGVNFPPKYSDSIEGRLESDYNAFWKIGKERTPQYIVFRSDQILPKYLIRYRVSKQEMPQPNNGKWVLTNRENQQYNRGNHENPQYNPGTLPE